MYKIMTKSKKELTEDENNNQQVSFFIYNVVLYELFFTLVNIIIFIWLFVDTNDQPKNCDEKLNKSYEK